MNLSASKQFYKWWRCSSTLGISYNAYNEIDRNKAIASATGFYFSVENELSLDRGWSLDTSYHFAQGELQNLVDRYGARHWMGLNIRKKFWKDSATIRLSIDDPFNMNRVTSMLSYNGVERSYARKWNTQQVALGFTYNFGTSENSNQRQSYTEEAGRM